jgi:predicted RNA-binding Zn-ribbon protein involved in translation (DUF1610 family)
MSVTLIQKIRVTPIKCPRCGYYWKYGGKNKHVATCPHCGTTISIRKHTVRQTGQSLVRPGQSADIVQQPTGGTPHG